MTRKPFRIGVYDSLRMCWRAMRFLIPQLYTLLTTREFCESDSVTVIYKVLLSGGGGGKSDFRIIRQPVHEPQECNDLAVVRAS